METVHTVRQTLTREKKQTGEKQTLKSANKVKCALHCVYVNVFLRIKWENNYAHSNYWNAFIYAYWMVMVFLGCWREQK